MPEGTSCTSTPAGNSFLASSSLMEGSTMHLSPAWEARRPRENNIHSAPAWGQRKTTWDGKQEQHALPRGLGNAERPRGLEREWCAEMTFSVGDDHTTGEREQNMCETFSMTTLMDTRMHYGLHAIYSMTYHTE